MTINAAPSTEPTISDIEQTVQIGLEALRHAPLNDQITAALKFLIPPGYRPIAQFEEDGRKKRNNAAASNWNPETGEIVIYFERQETESNARTGETSPTPSMVADEDSRKEAFERFGRQQKAGIRENLLNTPESERLPKLQLNAQSDLLQQKVSDSEIQELCLSLAESEKAGRSFIALKWFRDNELTVRDYGWTDSLAYRQAVLAKAFEVGAILTAQIPNPKAPQHPTTTIRLNRESKYAQAVAPRFQPIQLRGEGPSASDLILRDRERF